jgi:hypothetical protein
MSDRREQEKKPERPPVNDEDEIKKRSPEIDRFERCPTHGTVYPAGGSCPKC